MPLTNRVEVWQGVGKCCRLPVRRRGTKCFARHNFSEREITYFSPFVSVTVINVIIWGKSASLWGTNASLWGTRDSFWDTSALYEAPVRLKLLLVEHKCLLLPPSEPQVLFWRKVSIFPSFDVRLKFMPIYAKKYETWGKHWVEVELCHGSVSKENWSVNTRWEEVLKGDE